MSTQNQSLTTAIIKRTFRVPVSFVPVEPKTDTGAKVSRQLDVALISAGFKASGALLDRVAHLPAVHATEVAQEVVQAAKEIKGDHVQHNTYFKNFPAGVPDTLEFWTDLVQKTYGEFGFMWDGNLLALDGYGAYQHSYEEMVAAHEPFIDSAKNKLTVLHLGGSLTEEVNKLYLSLAESKVPANGDDLVLLKRLAEVCADEPQPEKIPVRENRAVINAVRVDMEKALLADTVTDVLRLAVQLSGGDVSLQEKTKFKSFSNKERRVILKTLDEVVSKNPGKLGDVYKNREVFKRLDERLHSGSYRKYSFARKVFETARLAENMSFESRLEKAFASKDSKATLELLEKAPGLFVKSFNRLLLQTSLADLDKVVKTLEAVLPKVATPTIVGLRQYIDNRTERKTNRVFINRKGTGKVVPDEQPVLGAAIRNAVAEVLDAEVQSRLASGVYIVNRDMLSVAMPLSNRQTSSGFGIMPRGSTDLFSGEVLRFFNYWKQKKSRTDYDLSAVLLNEDFTSAGQLSYTRLHEVGGVHSGDITSAPTGASEFIDIETKLVRAKYIIPQVNNYAGEDFDTVKESFFGYMERTQAEKGKPFEAKTVKSKADMRGKNKVALPLVFINNGDGTFTVKWINAFLKGLFAGNATENNTLSTTTMIRSIVENKYLTVEYLVDLLTKKPDVTVVFEDELGDGLKEDVADIENGVTYIGREVPEGLPEETKTITLLNLHELL
jgi:hypothetical protein